MSTSTANTSNIVDVAIIGGGIAGLAAAWMLRRLGRSSVILEARHYLGGRVWSSADGIELGAEFIHGRGHVTWDLCSEFGLEIERYPSPGAAARMFVYQGEIIADPRFESEVERIVDLIERYDGRDISIEDYSRTLHGFDERALFFAEDMIARVEGADIRKLSAKALSEERKLNTSGWENYRIRGGYRKLILALSERVNSRLGARVTTVQYIGRNRYALRLSSGERVFARNVLVTVPLSMLKLGQPRFDPVLPAPKVRALKALAMGDVTKILLKFSRDVFPQFSYITTNSVVRLWWRSRVADYTVLTGFSGGSEQASELAELDNSAVICGLAELERLFGAAVRDNYVDGFLIDWAREEWISGAYSYTPVGALGCRELLAQPIDNGIFFAGEATSTNGHVGTVHGAIESALRAARQIPDAASA